MYFIIKMNILVTGGAGYIGSHTVKELLKRGHSTIVIDNLSTGHRESIPAEVLFVKGNVGETEILENVFSNHNIDIVIHFAGSIDVAESTRNPSKYFHNNTSNTLSLLTAMSKYNVKKIICSSTAAVYGKPQQIPIDENHAKNPHNSYGLSKLMAEQVLDAFEKAHDLKYVILRYFNAAGADESGELGENHQPETHLIPLAIKASLGLREGITIFGNDYQTKDGTCIRDYIHVTDLAEAHILAMDYLVRENDSNTFNLGSGEGYSVREIIKAVEEVAQIQLKISEENRRQGDPGILVASYKKAESILGWKPKRCIKKIIETAYNWHQKKDKVLVCNQYLKN